MKFFKTIPFVRILLPFILGIYINSRFQLNVNPFVLLLILGALLSFLFFLDSKRSTMTSRYSFIALADVFLFLCALYCCFAYNAKNNEKFYGKYVKNEQQFFTGEVIDLPQEKEKFLKVKLSLNGLKVKDSICEVKGVLIAYFKKPIDKSILKPGNIVVFESRLNMVDGPLNPNEFNYKEFLANKNIFYQSFVDSGNCSLYGNKENFSLMNFGLSIKQKIIHAFKNSDLDPEAANLCIALLTGYDDDINSETISAFAHSGTLHVLSVSGLHTGILYGILIFVLGIFDRNRKYKFIQLLIIIFSLWFFALITGFSPPVLRAVIMLNLLATGRFYFNYASENAINVLAVSAFWILFFSPLLLFDTGFLLSYMAIIGIIYFEPHITALVKSENYFVNKIWQLSSVSIAAQISTLPITLYLFHQFPIWFVFSNLIVIPLCSGIMLLGFLVILKLNFISPIINSLTKVIYFLIHLTDDPHWGYLDEIDFSATDMLLLSLCILLLTVLLTRRSYPAGFALALIILFWQFNSILECFSKKSSSQITIYQINKGSAVDIKNKTTLFYDSSISENDHNFHVKPNHTSYNYPQMISSNIDFVKGEKTSFFYYKNSSHRPLIDFLKPDVILVSNDAELQEPLTNIKTLIADGSNSYKQIKKLKRLCDKFAVPFYSTKEKGYISLNLN